MDQDEIGRTIGKALYDALKKIDPNVKIEMLNLSSGRIYSSSDEGPKNLPLNVVEMERWKNKNSAPKAG